MSDLPLDVPAVVIPEPLLRIFPHPGLDLVVEHLRRRIDVDLPLVVARQSDLRLDLQPEPVSRKADAARRVNLDRKSVV